MPTNATIIPSTQQPMSSSASCQQPSTLMNNAPLNLGITPVQAAQPQQASFVPRIASQNNTCPLPVTNYQTCSINDAQRFSNRCYYADCEYQVSNNPAVPFQSASIAACSISSSNPACNINQSMNNQHVRSQREGSNCIQPQYQQHHTRPLFPKQSAPPTRTSVPVSSSMHFSDAVLHSMTSPISDNPTSVLWSRANRLKPSPVAAVAPQVKDERLSPPENDRNEDDTQEVDESTQQSPEVQQRSSRSRSSNAARRQTSQPQPRRTSARVQAKNQPSTNEQPPAVKPASRQKKNGRVQQGNKQQQQVSQPTRIYTQQPGPKPLKKSTAAQRKRKQEPAQDVYEFEEESRLVSMEVPAVKRMKKTTGASQQIPKSYTKQTTMQNGPYRSYPDWVTQPAKISTKKAQPKANKPSHQWMVQDDNSTEDEYEFQDDESQSLNESTQEQIVPQKRQFGNTYANKGNYISCDNII